MRRSVRAMAVGACALASARGAAAEQERTLESPRFLGRGDTYVAAPDTDEATRANPATLAESAVKFQLRVLQLDVLVGENSLDSVSDVRKLSGDASAVKILQTFEDKLGKRQYARVQVEPVALRILSFELMPFFSTSNFVDLRVPTTPEVDFRSDTRVGLAMGVGLALTKTLDLGVTLRPYHRTLFTGEVAFGDVLSFVDDRDASLGDLFAKRQGVQVGWDLGGIWHPDFGNKAWRFGLLIEDLGYAGNFGDAETPPPPVPQRVSLGTSYRLDLKPWSWDFAADVQDVVNPGHLDWFRLLHLGTEIGRSYISRDNDIGLMGGVNEGYLTTGLFVDAFLARLTVSYYAVELGEYAGQRADRRWGATLATTITF
jgi:hypothetical protein